MALPLEDQRTILVVRPDRRRERDARQTTTFLRPPILAAAPTLTFDQQRLRLVLTEQSPRRPLSSRLAPPAADALTEGQQRVRVVLAAETSAQQRPLASKLSPPIFQQAADPVETVVRVVKAVRARFDRRDAQQPILGAPVVLNPMALPLEDQRTVNVVIPKADQRQQRRKSSSRLFPPVVAQSVTAPVVRLLSVFAPRVQQRARDLSSKLFPPAVVDQPPVVTKLLTSLSESPRFRQLGTKVRPPATLAAPAAPVETTIRVVKAVRARFDRRKAMQPVLRGPIVVDPAAAAGPPVETDLRVVLPVRRQPGRHTTKSRLNPPAVVGAAPQPPVETDLRVVFPVRTQRQRYATKYELQPPAVVAAQSGPVVVGILTTLAAIQTRAQHRKRTRLRSLLRPPAVVNQPAVPPVETELRVVYPVRRQPGRHGTKYELLPPVVVRQPPVVTDLLSTLAAIQTRAQRPKRDLPKSRLSRPAVIGPPAQPPVVTDLRTVFPVRLHPDRYGTTYELLPPTVVRPAPICPDLDPAGTATLTLTGATDGTLTLSAPTDGTLTLAPASDGSLSFGAASDGTLTLTPAEDCHDE
jgi:hypothetical protein